MPVIKWLNRRRLVIRWPLKWLVFGTVVLFVLFPRIDRLPTTLKRHRDPNRLIEPEAAALAPLLEEFEGQRRDDWDSQTLFDQLEGFVYDKIPYGWDWDLWGNVDYFPTVTEAITKGREDCDGRAVVAASVLRHYGYNARLATDFAHVWVVTDRGETMGPGKRKAVEFTDEGPRIDWRAAAEMPRTASLGIAVFPLMRELILVLAAWMLMAGRDVRARDAFAWLAVLVAGLMFLREGGRVYAQGWIKVWVGFLLWAVALIALVVQARRAMRDGRSAATSLSPQQSSP